VKKKKVEASTDDRDYERALAFLFSFVREDYWLTPLTSATATQLSNLALNATYNPGVVQCQPPPHPTPPSSRVPHSQGAGEAGDSCDIAQIVRGVTEGEGGLATGSHLATVSGSFLDIVECF
jgi:hypothetical protein